jgi:excisionase family DNA binding protein
MKTHKPMSIADKLACPLALLTVREAADASGTSASTLWREVKRGHLSATRFGTRTTRFKVADVLTWMKAGEPAAQATQHEPH